MKRTLFYACVVCLILASTSAFGQYLNLLENPGFEDGVLSPWEDPYGTAAVTTAEAHSGAYSVGYSSAGGAVAQVVPVFAGEVFFPSLWVKITNANLTIKTWYSWGVPGNPTYSNQWGANLKGTLPVNEWVLIDGDKWANYTPSGIVVPEGITTVRFTAMYGYGGGPFYADDAQMLVVIPEPGSLFALASGLIGLVGLRCFRKR